MVVLNTDSHRYPRIVPAGTPETASTGISALTFRFQLTSTLNGLPVQVLAQFWPTERDTGGIGRREIIRLVPGAKCQAVKPIRSYTNAQLIKALSPFAIYRAGNDFCTGD